MRKLKTMLVALLCAVTTIVTLGAVNSFTARADETSDYVYRDTSVISVTANADLPGYPRLELTGVDYKDSNGTYNKDKDYSIIAGLNTFSKIKIDGVAAGAGYDGTLTDPYLNMFDNGTDRFAFKSDAFTAATEIVVEAGCEFPSFALWSGTGNVVYRTTEDTIFKKEGDVWKKQIVFTYSDTSVIGISANADLPGYPRLELTGVDYKASNGTYNKGKDYSIIAGLNTFSKIKIDGVAAGAGYDGTLTDPHLNMYDNDTDRFAFKSDAFTTATEIVIEAGCEFPSFALWSGTGNVVYRTTEDAMFKKEGDVWKKQIVFTYSDTSVIGISANADLPGYPRLELTGVDYKASNGTYNKGKDYSIIAGLNTFSKIKIDGVAAGAGYDGTLTDPHLNMYDNDTDRFAFKSDAFVSASEIVIEEGCEFPSYALWSGLGATVYKTTETVTFRKVGDGWYRVYTATFVDEAGNKLGENTFTLADADLVYPDYETEVGYDYTWTGNEIKAENITVTLKKTIKTFDVKIGDAEAVKYNYGTTIEKPETDPEKAADAEYTYTFAGWFNGEEKWDFETDTVTDNVTLAARFDKTAIIYTLIYKNYRGTETTVEFTTLTRAEKLAELKALLHENDEQFIYENNFPDELPLENGKVYEEKRTIRKYTVIIGDNAPVQVDYGSLITRPADPVKEEDEEYTYRFIGWYNGEIEWQFENYVVYEDVTLTAKFEAVRKEPESTSDGSSESETAGSFEESGSYDGSTSGSGTTNGCFGSVASGLPFVSILLFAGAMIIKTKKND